MDRPASNTDASFHTARSSPSWDEARDSVNTLLERLHNVKNARDLSDALPSICPGRVFRSGTPSRATESDALLLRRDLAVQVFIDFRSPAEHREDTAWPHVLSQGVIKSYDYRGTVAEMAVEELPGFVPDGEAPLPHAELHQLSLLERSKFIRGLLPRLPYWTVASAAWYKLIGDDRAMRGAIVPLINEGGLLQIYEIMLATSGPELARALGVLLEATRAQQPTLFFCKLGKDRTGTFAALVLAACGATREQIVDDYERSDGAQEVALGGIEKMEDVSGMDTKLFERAPPEAMYALLDHVDARYGGMDKYMDSIGFSFDQQAELRAALTDGDRCW